MTTIASSTRRDDLQVLLEGSIYLCLIVVGAIALQMQWISVGSAVRLVVCLLLGLLFLAWHRFDGGRHPCFLFLGMLLIFQGGRLIGYAFGVLDDPFQIVVGTTVPFDITRSSAETTLLLIALSAICVYLPCRWRFTPAKLEASGSDRWLPAAYFLLLITFPFMLYKNYIYLSYVRDHGGYLAVFTDSQAIVNSAGLVVRSVSLVAYNLFLVIFVLERRRKYLIPLTALFFASSVLELMLGLRGKVFLLLITLWYVSNLKKGSRFRLIPLAVTVAVLSLLAALVAGFRENRASAFLSPVQFISDQGMSLGVTEAAVEFRPLFGKHAARYLIDTTETAYKPASSFGEGQLFADDLSLFLNRRAFALGFATGSSYLAESYLAGGTAFVVVASVIIGLALRLFHKMSNGTAGATVLILLLPSMIYLPRTGLLDPVATGLKSLLIVALILSVLRTIHPDGRSARLGSVA
jgi:hypothetical protein